jgi:Tol biopolymer transport system component
MTSDWSPDGRFILYSIRNPKSGVSLWALPLIGEGKPLLVAQNSTQDSGRFSPAGGWVAYASVESGRSHVYIQPFPGSGSKVQVSANIDAFSPEWRRDGRELFYVEAMAGSSRMMAVPMV